ncbi:MAG: CPBP family intramembrane metalloprotease [Myxococcales bacterium]|nr:CPBP family intramembrane metalloprotease [Myxococcales bacterium]
MNRRAIWTIFRKEVTETLRDKRTLYPMILIPLVLYPALLLLVTQVASVQQTALEQQVTQVALVPPDAPTDLAQLLDGDPLIKRMVVVEEPRVALAARNIDAVLVWENPADTPDGTGTTQITVLHDESEERSQLARDRLASLLGKWERTLLEDRLSRRQIELSYIDPIDVVYENIASATRMGGYVLGQILPLLLILTVVIGAFYPAVDLTAGEKERGTFQTLLTAPILPFDIVGGKLLAVFAIALFAGSVNIASMALLFGHALSFSGVGADISVQLDLGQWVLLLVSAVVMGFFFSALMMTIAVLARSFKEAQSYLTPVYFVCVIPAMLTQLPGMHLGPALALVPAMNISLLVKALLQGTATPDAIFWVLTSTLVYTGLVITAAAALFRREAVLLGDLPPWRALRSPGAVARHADTSLSPTEAVLLYCIAFVLLYYLGSAMQMKHLLAGVAGTQLLVILLPTVLFLRLRQVSLRNGLLFRRPPRRFMLAAILLGFGVWPVAFVTVDLIQSRFLPVPTELAEEMTRLFSDVDSPLQVAGLVAAIAVLPGICEELLFRGAILQSFRSVMGIGWSVLFTSVLFGALHLSLYRFLGTAVLGAIAALLVIRGQSIVPGMIFHVLNNTSLALAVLAPASLPIVDPTRGIPSTWAIGIGSVLTLAGFGLLIRYKQKPTATNNPDTNGLGVDKTG